MSPTRPDPVRVELRWRWLRARRARGYSLLEILVVLAIIGLIAGVTAVAMFKFIPEARIKTTRESARAVRASVSLYRMQHATEDCPTLPMLIQSQLIDEASKTTDAWETPFAIECDERGGILVASAGPDKKLGTPDDVRVPDPPPAQASR